MDQLYDFACQFLENYPISADMPMPDPISKMAVLDAALLFREAEFQVEMFSLPPNYIVPAHVHPNVDSFEVYVSGQMKFSLQGQFVFESVETVEGKDKESFKWRMLRIKPDDKHGVITGPQGARFISIQHWLNGVTPHCIAADYSGPVMDSDHLLLIKSGQPQPRRQIDLKEYDAL